MMDRLPALFTFAASAQWCLGFGTLVAVRTGVAVLPAVGVAEKVGIGVWVEVAVAVGIGVGVRVGAGNVAGSAAPGARAATVKGKGCPTRLPEASVSCQSVLTIWPVLSAGRNSGTVIDPPGPTLGMR
jgi:hypothetical protein